MVHGSWPKPKRLPRGALKPNEYKGSVLQTPDIDGIQIPWIMDHGAIPWVLLALDPGAQDHGSCCPGAWFMNHNILCLNSSHQPPDVVFWYILESR